MLLKMSAKQQTTNYLPTKGLIPQAVISSHHLILIATRSMHVSVHYLTVAARHQSGELSKRIFFLFVGKRKESERKRGREVTKGQQRKKETYVANFVVVAMTLLYSIQEYGHHHQLPGPDLPCRCHKSSLRNDCCNPDIEGFCACKCTQHPYPSDGRFS